MPHNKQPPCCVPGSTCCFRYHEDKGQVPNPSLTRPPYNKAPTLLPRRV